MEAANATTTPRPLNSASSNATNITSAPPMVTTSLPWPKATPIPTDPQQTDAPSPTPTPSVAELKSPTSTDDDTSTSITVVAVLGAVIALGLLTWIWRRLRRRGERTGDESIPPSSFTNHTSNAPTAASSATSAPVAHNDGINWHHLNLLRVDVDAIQCTKPLASGSFGTIWLGSYMHRAVAVKSCSKSSRGDIQSFLDELDLMASLTCPSIVALLAVAWTKATDIKAALEFMNMGDLRDFLAQSKDLSSPPPWSQKIAIAVSIVRALVYLKARGIIHRDLKSRNVLLDTAAGTKLADFGISRRESEGSMTTGVGTYRWMAPEVLAFRHYSVAVDVFSFGVLLSELDTHELPYWDVGKAASDAAVVWRVLNDNLRPTFSPQCPPWIVDLAAQCMLLDPATRPTPEHILAVLQRHLDDVETPCRA